MVQQFLDKERAKNCGKMWRTFNVMKRCKKSKLYTVRLEVAIRLI